MTVVQQKRLHLIVHLICITLLSVLLSRFIIYDISSLSVFSPMEKASDFQMSDIYLSVAADKGKIKQLSNQITIIALDGCTRQEIIDVIDIISEFEPTAIGLDICFQNPTNDDSHLISTLSTTPNLVLPCKIYSIDNHYERTQFAFYEDIIQGNYGFVNLYANTRRDVIREFKPYIISNNDTICSLPFLMVTIAHNLSPAQLLKRDHSTETITFDNTEFYTINAKTEILEDNLSYEQLTRWIQGKIILLGDINDFSDSYQTPLNDSMAGVMIHAYTLNTILNETYINITPTWLNWLIAVIICVLFVWLNIIAKQKMNNMGNLLVRVVQLLTIYLLIVIGCEYYVHWHRYFDFAPAVLMIGLGALSFDLWFGAYSLVLYIKHKIRKK